MTLLLNLKKTLVYLSTAVLILGVFTGVLLNISAVEPVDPESNICVIDGFVTDAETSRGLLEVEVSFYDYSGKEDPTDSSGSGADSTEPANVEYYYFTFTNSDGHYEFNVPQSVGLITFYLKGYESYDQEIKLEQLESLRLNVTLKAIPPPPEPDAVLKGVVADENTGNGIKDVSLSFSRDYTTTDDQPKPPASDDPNGIPRDETTSTDTKNTEEYSYIQDWFNARTDSTGKYEVELFSGTYWVSAYVYSTDTAETEYYSFSGKVIVTENTTTYYNITLKPLPPRDAFIKGYVKDSETGKPVANMGVSAYKYSNVDQNIEPKPRLDYSDSGTNGYYEPFYYGDSAFAITDSVGYFKLNLRPGTYSVNAGGTYTIYNTGDYYYDDIWYEYDEYGETGSGDSAEGGTPPPGEAVESGESTASKETGTEEDYPVGAPDNPDDGFFAPSPMEYYPFSTTAKLESKTTVWLNISLRPIPPLTSTIKGTVKNAVTGEPVVNAYISVTGYTQGYSNYYWASTDLNGDYFIKVREGYYVMTVEHYWYGIYEYDMIEFVDKEYPDAGTRAETEPAGSAGAEEPVDNTKTPPDEKSDIQYFQYKGTLMVGHEKTVVHDVDLIPYPEETSVIHGVVKDKSTGAGLNSVSIMFVIDLGDNKYTKYAYTNGNGEYSVDVPESTVTITINNHRDWNYYDKETSSGETGTDPADSTVEPGIAPPPDYKETYTSYFGYRTAFEIDADSDITFDIELEQVPEFSNMITGKVLDENNNPVKYAWVALIDFGHYYGMYDPFVTQTWTDETGKYTLWVYPGKFGLVADGSWYLSVDGYDSTFQWITFDSTGETKNQNIVLTKAESNTVNLKFKFSNWQSVTYTATMTMNENAFGLRYYIDNYFGNGDGTLESSELDSFSSEWITTAGTTPFAQLSVDSVTYHVVPGSTPGISMYVPDGSDEQEVYSNDPFVFTVKMQLAPYKSISESSAEHDVELLLNKYLPAEIEYSIEFPSGFELTGFEDDSGGNSVSGIGDSNIFINSPFDYNAWNDIYGPPEGSYREKTNLDAGDASDTLLGNPGEPKNDGSESGNGFGNDFGPGAVGGSSSIKMKVVNEDLRKDESTSALSGTQKAAVVGIVIVVVLVLLMMLAFFRKKRVSQPVELDERHEELTPPEDNKPGRPIPSRPASPPKKA